jgi:hypothetical protein
MRGLDTSVPHPARIYDYWLGGKDNFAADREAAERILTVMPFMRELSRANRLFLATAVHHLVQTGVRQFLDIGTGLPAANNTHEVAQRVAPDARVVYVDNDRSKSGCSHAWLSRLSRVRACASARVGGHVRGVRRDDETTGLGRLARRQESSAT